VILMASSMLEVVLSTVLELSSCSPAAQPLGERRLPDQFGCVGSLLPLTLLCFVVLKLTLWRKAASEPASSV
jgi:hypothetical protein